MGFVFTEGVSRRLLGLLGKNILFDAVIGNTDRHQDNWGILWRRDDKMKMFPRYAPAFDNGTSLLHEIMEANLFKFNDMTFVDKYIDRGTHHIRWDINSAKPAGHFELLVRLGQFRPALANAIATSLTSDFSGAFERIRALSTIDVPVPLSAERVETIIRVVNRRIERLRAIFLRRFRSPILLNQARSG